MPSVFSDLGLAGRGIGLGAAFLEPFPGAFTWAGEAPPDGYRCVLSMAKGSTAVRTALEQELGRGSHNLGGLVY